MTDLTLVVCTRGRPASVRRLLEAVAGQDRRPDEVLVVDASDDEATAAVVAAVDLPGLRHRPVDPERRGLTRQRNIGVDEASGALVAFLDDDTVPDPAYFAEIVACFDRHPDALGVGGAIEEAPWRPSPNGRGTGGAAPDGWFHWDGWERPLGSRWNARRRLGLAPKAPPGWMPPAGHGWPVAFLPPSGQDYEVEFVMGGASCWRRDVFATHAFPSRFEGYGLYEDLDFCIEVSRDGPLYLCTRAVLRHEHDPASRPTPAHYGRMVVENGWYVWRRRWPEPSAKGRARWWATSTFLALARLAGVARRETRRGAVAEFGGRVAGLVATAPAEVSRRYRRRRFGAQHGERRSP